MRDTDRLLGVGSLRFDATTNGAMKEATVVDAESGAMVVMPVPEIMVAYKDSQAYPEYLVTFEMTS